MNQEDKTDSPDAGRRHSFLKRFMRRMFFVPLLAIAGLYFLSLTTNQPENLGIVNGQLAQCPPSPNCVSTMATLDSQKMPPIAFDGDTNSIKSKIKSTILDSFPRAKLITENEDYLHFQFTSLIFRFVDDVEFLIEDEDNQIHFRSASRVGHSDLGANRKRMTRISESLKQ